MSEARAPHLPRLFSPVSVGRLTIPNRIVATAHSTGISDGNRIGDRLIAYYEARARNGVGLIITGSTSVHPTSTSRLLPALSSWDESVIEPYRKLAAAIRPYGTRVFAQLNHAGAQSGRPGGPLLAPSAIDTELGIETPHALEPEQIDEIVRAFAAAARRARDGGLDGVELHGGHGNLIQQFLSPLTNRRIDAYGGTCENRLRFACEVGRATRHAVGPDFVVGMRISAEEDVPGGLTLADMRRMTPALVAAGALDYLNVTSGSDSWTWSLAHHYAPAYVPTQHMRHLARGIRDVVSVPVIAVGRIVDPRDAEAILAAGDADLIGMTRALIADKELPAKARRGAFDDVRYCVGANDGCIGRLMRGLPITCIQDPTSGREQELAEVRVAPRPRRVVVVGGGVAGLEAARLAAVRGHDVTVIERLTTLGGQLQIARRAPGRAELGMVADHLIRSVGRQDIRVFSGMEATGSDIMVLEPEVVIVATGSTAVLPDFNGGSLVSARSVLEGAAVGGAIVVFDSKGDMVGLTTADWLAERGHAVTVVTPFRTPGPKIEPMTARLLHRRLLDRGVSILVDGEVTGFSDRKVVVRHTVGGHEVVLSGIDAVVAACGDRAVDGVYHELRRLAPDLEIKLVGDAAAPRQIEQAIYEGHMAARAI